METKRVKNELYEPPKIEVIEVDVEGGFCMSGYGQDSYDDYEFGERY